MKVVKMLRLKNCLEKTKNVPLNPHADCKHEHNARWSAWILCFIWLVHHLLGNLIEINYFIC